MLRVEDPIAFTDAIADILRLPDETLATTYVYINKYKRFQRSSQAADRLDPYTLSLSAISLASKATESPRRLRDIILPAHRLLHPETSHSNVNAIERPLAVHSPIYDTLRGTVVQAEILLLRVLGFELRLPSPLDFLRRYLERAMEDVTDVAEDYDSWDREGKEEFGVGEVMETRLARAARQKAVEVCKSFQLANLFPARAIALGVVFFVMSNRSLVPAGETRAWVRNVSSNKVDNEDFEEVMEILRKSLAG